MKTVPTKVSNQKETIAFAFNTTLQVAESTVVTTIWTQEIAVMGCGSSKSASNGGGTGGNDDDGGFRIPSVQRSPATKLNQYSTQKDDDLPLGILLTGGRKLRSEGYTGTGIKVAVIDSGIDEQHPEFHGMVTRKVWYREGTLLSEDDHGTHVAGTIHLMAPSADIYDYRVFGATGDVGVVEAIAQAIRAAADVNCQLINMSLGGPTPSPEIKSAIDYAVSKGVICVCAAGNEGDNNSLTNEISYPAAYEKCISIAAVQKRNGFPVAVFSNSNSEVDYAGIGVDVVSFKPGGGYQEMSGTSMACPHACGLMACLMQKYGAKGIRNKLTQAHAIDIGVEGIDNATGVGLLTYLSGDEFDQYMPRKELAQASIY